MLLLHLDLGIVFFSRTRTVIPLTSQIIIGAPSYADTEIAANYDRGKIYVYQVNKYAPGRPSFPRARIDGPRQISGKVIAKQFGLRA